jgi:hypothetical protein
MPTDNLHFRGNDRAVELSYLKGRPIGTLAETTPVGAKGLQSTFV